MEYRAITVHDVMQFWNDIYDVIDNRSHIYRKIVINADAEDKDFVCKVYVQIDFTGCTTKADVEERLLRFREESEKSPLKVKVFPYLLEENLHLLGPAISGKSPSYPCAFVRFCPPHHIKWEELPERSEKASDDNAEHAELPSLSQLPLEEGKS